MNTGKTCQGIPSNADISGIGVRINIYATMLITAGCPRKPWAVKTLEALNANAGLTGFGLLITAIVQTFRKQLDLYHAILVLHMIYSLGLILYLSGAFRKTISHFRPESRALVQMVMMGLFLSWSAYVWAHAKTFGSSPECNTQVTYIFLFIPVGATVTWLRLYWIWALAVTVGITLLGIIVVGLRVLPVACIASCARGTADVDEDGFEIQDGYSPKSFLISVGLITFSALAIALLELLILRNKHLILPGENVWAFGQVLSVVMIVSCLREIWTPIRYLWKRYVWVWVVGHGPHLNGPRPEMY